MKKKVKLEFTKVLHVNIKSYCTVHDSCVYVWFRIYLSIIPINLKPLLYSHLYPFKSLFI